jgi:HlyD family secretion protein
VRTAPLHADSPPPRIGFLGADRNNREHPREDRFTVPRHLLGVPEAGSRKGNMNAKTQKRILAAGAVAVALAAGGVVLARSRAQAEAPAWETATVDRGDVVVRVTASGTVAARRTVLVSSQVSGRLKELHADYNGLVTKGDLLARIDPQPFEAAVAQAQASSAAARANLTKARAKVADLERQSERRRVLLERKLIAEEEWEAGQAELEIARAEASAAEAGLAQAKAALDQARFNLSNTAIRSPIDGIVVSRDVDVGQTVAASLQAPTLFTIAEDLKLMEVQAHVSESDVGRIADGMAATFTVDAWPGERMDGKVRQVRNAATTTQNVVTYDVILDVENPELRLRPGMTANVTFVVSERRDVLRVPNAALRFRPAGAAAAAGATGSGASARGGAAAAADRKVVHAVAAGQLRPVPVRVGVTDGSHTELVEGALEAGTPVATRSLVKTGGGNATDGDAARTSQRAGGSGAPPPPRMF